MSVPPLRFAALLAVVLLAAVPPSAAEPLATFGAEDGFLRWSPLVATGGTTLSLAGPGGAVRTLQFAAGEAPSLALFDARGFPLADGVYTWELRGSAPGDAEPSLPPLVQSGHFTIAGGDLVEPDLTEPSYTAAADQLVPDDFIIDGKGCIGLGCGNNELFGPEALRLKQSVVRLRFEDTSASGGLFPGNDWQLTVNDAGSGGVSKFSIEDLTGGKVPVTVLAGAPNHSLYVGAVGNVGLGTATPSYKLDVSGNVRVTGAAGYGGALPGAVVGGQATTFVSNGYAGLGGIRMYGLDTLNTIWQSNPNTDLAITTNGGNLKLAAAVSSTHLTVLHSGSVGIGTVSPASKLHVHGGDIRVSGGSFIDDGVTLVPDYAFEPGYELMPLAELAAYVEREKHLPNLPSAAEIKAHGLNLSQFQMRLLEKIEELTLYVLAQEKQAQELRKLVEDQRALLEELRPTARGNPAPQGPPPSAKEAQ